MNGKRRWNRNIRLGALLGTIYAEAMVVFYLSSLAILMVEIIDEFHIGRTLALNIPSITGGILPISGIIGGGVITRIGFGPTVLIGLILVVTGLFISFFVNSVAVLLITASAIPAFGAGLIAVSNAGLIVRFGGNNSDFWIIVLTATSSITRSFAPIVFNYFLILYTWKGACLMLSAFGLQLLPLIYFIVIGEASVNNPQSKIGSDGRLKSICTCHILTIVTSVGLTRFVVSRPFTYISDVIYSKGYTITEGALALTLAGIGSIPGQVMIAVILNKFDICLPVWTALVCSTSQVVCIIYTLNINYTITCILCVMSGVAWGVINPLTMMCIKRYVDQARLFSFAWGIASVNDGILNLVNGPAAGFLRDETGDYNAYIYTVAVMALVPFVLFLVPVVRKSRAKRTTEITEKETENALVESLT